MRRRTIQFLQWLTAVMILAGPAAGVTGGETKTMKAGDLKISGPYTHKNLSIYLIEGKETLPAEMELLTLDEALKQKILVVHETGNVNKLAVENKSKDKVVFIQSGDVVKGGKQDRVLAVDLVVRAGSGKIPIDSFCVEQGRWARRGSEATTTFQSSRKRVTGKGLRYAMRGGRSGQSKVWKKVEEEQDKLSEKLKADVKAQRSASSYQLTRENKKVEATSKEYTKALREVIKKNPKAIGYAFVVNGKFSSADVYGSRRLFEKVWPKMLESCAVEAIADYDKKKAAARPDSSWVQTLTDMEKVKETRRRKVAKNFNYVTKENKKAVQNKAADDQGMLYHFSLDAVAE